MRGRDLGRAGKGVDLALGVLAIVPLLLLAWAAFAARAEEVPIVKTAAVIWTGCLLAFLAGVRRGLSFSEADGARPTEIASFLALFGVAVLTLLFRSPGLGVGGLALVAVLDGAAAGAGQAPPSFRLLRPAQMIVACLALVLVGSRTGF